MNYKSAKDESSSVLRSTTGFTLIELLVVIAIIGILSSVILASLNTARAKGANAAIKSDVNSIRAQSNIVYEDNGGYYNAPQDICLESHVRPALDHAGLTATGVDTDGVCLSAPGAWAVQAPLKTPDPDGSTYWCADWDGASKGETVALADTVCP